MGDNGVYIVCVVLDGLAHGPGVRRCEPGEGRAGQNLHHARAHDVPKAHVREVGDGQGDEVDPIAHAERSGEPHEQGHHLPSVGQGT